MVNWFMTVFKLMLKVLVNMKMSDKPPILASLNWTLKMEK